MEFKKRTFDIESLSKFGFSASDYEQTWVHPIEYGKQRAVLHFNCSHNGKVGTSNSVFCEFVVSFGRIEQTLDSVHFVIYSNNNSFDPIEVPVETEQEFADQIEAYAGFMPFEVFKKPMVITTEELSKIGFKFSEMRKSASIEIGNVNGQKITLSLQESADGWEHKSKDGKVSHPANIEDVVKLIIEVATEVGKYQNKQELKSFIGL